MGARRTSCPIGSLSDGARHPATRGLDLGAELDGLFETQAAVAEPAAASAATDLGDAGLADIFKEFKKGVDKQLGKEDYDTRYNLGIAYKEMGLVDEAIAEFQLAARDQGRLLECSSMLGICFLEKGMAKLAVKWFEKGLARSRAHRGGVPGPALRPRRGPRGWRGRPTAPSSSTPTSTAWTRTSATWRARCGSSARRCASRIIHEAA